MSHINLSEHEAIAAKEGRLSTIIRPVKGLIILQLQDHVSEIRKLRQIENFCTHFAPTYAILVSPKIGDENGNN